MTIEELYQSRCRGDVQWNDIWEHMGTLRRLAAECAHITEIGTRTGNSATAFLMGLADRGGGIMHSYDKAGQEFHPPAIPGVTWTFHQANSHDESCKPEPTELLFIDGCHRYDSVRQDLRHAAIASRYVILHDTEEERDRMYGDGVVRAMNEFLQTHPEWRIKERCHNNNGLTVLERVAK